MFWKQYIYMHKHERHKRANVKFFMYNLEDCDKKQH